MTVRERVIASHLIQKAENQGDYARQIGLSYRLKTVGLHTDIIKSISKTEKLKLFKEGL